MELSIYDLGGKQSILAGAIPGKNVLAKFIQQIRRTAEPSPLYLNFNGVEVATSSFLREAILGIRDYCRNADTNFYPVIANANDDVLEELQIMLEDKGEAMAACRLNARGKVAAAHIIGVLEEKQEITLEAVKVLKQADATTLMEKFGESEQIKVTGWNNRLAALAAKGILMEVKKGRTKYYQPVVEML